MRIDKFISVNSGFSRSEIRLAARRGKIFLNGEVCRNFDKKINPDTDKIRIYDTDILKTGYIYIVMNKPAGVISASDDKERSTVVDLVPEKYKHLELFPVGRLDKDTTGLLIITNDGEFAHKVISPKSNISKCYEVELDGKVEEYLVTEFKKGVVLADGTCCKPAELHIVGENTAEVIITEGKYHQIKRMFGVFELGVNKLHRKSIGDLVLPENLLSGQCICLEAFEIYQKVFKNA